MGENKQQEKNREISTNTRFKKGKSGNPVGRPMGSKNKFTTLKKAFLEAFKELGGAEGLCEWAEKSQTNKRAFYQMITKLLPSSITGEIDIKEIPPLKFTQVKDKDDTEAK